MKDEGDAMRDRLLLRIGAVGAILGTIFSVAAGIGFGELPTGDTEDALRFLAVRSAWYWRTVHLGFIFGALLWVGALTALAVSGTLGGGSALGPLGAASAAVGAAIHVVDSSISGFGLRALADAWSASPDEARPDLLLAAHTVSLILDGTWASVTSFFHGLPFVLVGLAVVLSRRYPAWLGWIGVVGGAGALLIGALMFLDLVPERLFVAFALLVSLFMLILGALMWRQADAFSLAELPVAARRAPASGRT